MGNLIIALFFLSLSTKMIWNLIYSKKLTLHWIDFEAILNVFKILGKKIRWTEKRYSRRCNSNEIECRAKYVRKFHKISSQRKIHLFQWVFFFARIFFPLKNVPFSNFPKKREKNVKRINSVESQINTGIRWCRHRITHLSIYTMNDVFR